MVGSGQEKVSELEGETLINHFKIHALIYNFTGY